MRWILMTALALSTCGLVAPGTVPAIPSDTAKMLFCSYGGISPMPLPPTPPGFESEFAEVVVEVDGTRFLSDVAVSQFSVLNSSKQAVMSLKRVISIERFIDAPPKSNWGYATYYLSPELADERYKWNGTLPSGTVLLRVRMSVFFEGHESVGERCSLSIGPYQIEGPLDAVWPTG
jgi:hypothetical protein